MNAVLYTGTDPSRFITSKRLVHFPVIEMKIRDLSSQEMKVVWDDFYEYTHILFTSKNTILFFLEAMAFFSLSFSSLKNKKIYSIGKVTADFLEKAGFCVDRIAEVETQEGMIRLLKSLDEPYFFYPRSSLARSYIEQFLIDRGIRHQLCNLYQTIERKNTLMPHLEEFDEIVFTSPSTIKAFMKIFKIMPANKKITCIGPVTEEAYRLICDQ